MTGNQPPIPNEQSLCYTLTFTVRQPNPDGGEIITTLGGTGGVSPDPNLPTAELLRYLIRMYLEGADDPWIKAHTDALTDTVRVQCWTLHPNQLAKIIG
ncbi:hypothetical protein [Streptomyces noursei]|uniref:hypothetical protein n=1 Tax=Streptomyces noursei TaxID=1971 RepID=UPI00382AB843